LRKIVARHAGPASYLIAAAVPLLAVAWIIAHWPTVDAGTDQLGGARPGWLLAALAVAAMTWVAAAICQQGAIVERLPGGRLVAVQFAGSAANHILPAGLGGATVTLRFLRNRGLSRSSAVNVIALSTCAGITVHLVTLTVLVAAGLTAPPAPIRTGLIAFIVVTVLAGVGLGAAIAPRLRRRCTTAIRGQVRSAATQWAIVGRCPVRAVQLWTGSAAEPVLRAITLALITRALGAPIGVGAVFGVYFLASTVSAAVPSPSGFGALDAALIFGLTADGLTTTGAVAAVLAYRLITVWLPLIPSACILGILRRSAVI
jgi:glycosyltransferase 2 family protein